MMRAVVFLLCWSTVIAGNPTGCVTNVKSGVDLFPAKVKPKNSKYWSVEYYSTYKIARNLIVNESYLLYQCGTDIPSSVSTSDFTAVVPIPVKVVGLTQTPMITYMEQLGARNKIAAFLTDPTYIWSPCFAKTVASGTVAVRASRDSTNPTLVGKNPPQMSDMLAFSEGYEKPPFSTVIKVSESSEKTNQAIFEWVLFYSLFFNKEDVAANVTQAASDRFTCLQKNAAIVRTDSKKKPKLLWGYYSDYCQGWDVAKCPNYYCEFAEACAVDILNSTGGSNQEAFDLCGAVYMTTEEFVKFGMEADYWFFPAPNFNATLAQFGDQLANFTSVKRKQVYDYQGMGKNSWFEQRYAEYYNVLEDMCVTVGTISSTGLLSHRHFWRNVFTEIVPGDGVNGSCSNTSAANILSDPHQCGPNFGSSPSQGNMIHSLSALVTAACVIVALML